MRSKRYWRREEQASLSTIKPRHFYAKHRPLRFEYSVYQSQPRHPSTVAWPIFVIFPAEAITQ